MIARDDLRAAVGAGILDEAQAASLVALADSRRGARERLAPGDEPFEAFRGFNEIFIVVGLAVLSAGWAAITVAAVDDPVPGEGWDGILSASCAIFAVLLWSLSEYFVRRRRMVGPAIALAALFSLNALVGLGAWQVEPFFWWRSQEAGDFPVTLALATLAVLAFWLRFRVPAALALVALGLFAAALVLSASQGDGPDSIESIFLLSAEGSLGWLTLALGVLTFAAAMAFDMTDRHRVTRRSANGFWLHLVAAPAVVNTVSLSLLDSGTPGDMVLLGAFLALIALVAVVVDRRSFLIAGVGYVVAMAVTLADGVGSWAAITLALGAGLLCLGASWERIRGAVLRAAGPVLPVDRLPPAGG